MYGCTPRRRTLRSEQHRPFPNYTNTHSNTSSHDSNHDKSYQGLTNSPRWTLGTPSAFCSCCFLFVSILLTQNTYTNYYNFNTFLGTPQTHNNYATNNTYTNRLPNEMTKQFPVDPRYTFSFLLLFLMFLIILTHNQIIIDLTYS